jgi:hypothetical protein
MVVFIDPTKRLNDHGMTATWRIKSQLKLARYRSEIILLQGSPAGLEIVPCLKLKAAVKFNIQGQGGGSAEAQADSKRGSQTTQHGD